MRKRTMVVGGGLVGVAAVTGMWLSGLFKGFGTGSGTGDGTGSSAQVGTEGVQANVPADTMVRTTSPQELGGGGAREDGDALDAPSEVIDVIVEANEYAVQTGENQFRRVELPQLVELARAATGTDEGVRVRIRRRGSARVSMTERLTEELRQAGLKIETEVEIQPTLLPDRDETPLATP